jgi:D-alanine transaminase
MPTDIIDMMNGTARPPHVYLDGRILPKREASLSVEDRGTLFADGVYEVLRYYAGRPLAMDAHVARLRRSLAAIRLAEPDEVDRLADITASVLDHSGLRDAKVYWQITRGSAARDYAIPRGVRPTVLVMAYPAAAVEVAAPPACLRAAILPDERWANCWIKSLMLLGNMLATNAALDAGVDAAILQRDGRVTEGASTNVFSVRDGELWTHPADRWVLAGVTRALVLEIAAESGIPVHERPVTVDALLSADEVLLTGTTTHVAAVGQVGDRRIGTGEPGPITRQLHAGLMARIERACLAGPMNELQPGR